jgi:hypothetical protein
MAYLRGDNYFWSDGEALHIWSAQGRDHWDSFVWAESFQNDPANTASGLKIPEEVINAFVMMRVAELVENGLVEASIQNALAIGKANFGCESLVKNSKWIASALHTIRYPDTAE